MGDTGKNILKFAAISAAIFVTGGALGPALGLGAMSWGTAIMAAGVVQYAINASKVSSILDDLNDSTADQQAGVVVNRTGTEVSVPIIYGKAKVGMGTVDVRLATDQNLIAKVGTIAIAPESGSGIHEITNIYFNEDLAIEAPIFGTNNDANNPTPFDSDKIQSPWNGGVTSGTFGSDYWLEYFIHDGDDDQVVDFELNDVFTSAWGADARGVGVAYIVLWLYYDDAIYTNGVPNVTMEVKGNKVLDCQSLGSAAAYSENPADCIRDFMTSTRYGLGIPAEQIDATSFAAAAAYCDEEVTVTLSSGTHTLADRFTCNGFLLPDNGPLSNLERLLSSCCGRIVIEGGKYKLLIRQVQSAETFELNRTNIVGDWTFVRTGVTETPNTLVGTYVDNLFNYQPRQATWPEAGADNDFLTADNDYAVETRIDLPFTENAYMAEMICSQQFLERRADMGCALTAQREALKLSVGDVVNVTHDTPSWTDQKMWVEAVALGRDGLVKLALKEYDPDAYAVPTMTVQSSMMGASLPVRFASADSPTVTINSLSLTGELVTGTSYECNIDVNFSSGMGSYTVEHDPAGASAYEYTINFTGTSNVTTLQASGGGDYLFESDPADGSSDITITPYPDADKGGVSGPPMTGTFTVASWGD